jgi:hypothetical protein
MTSRAAAYKQLSHHEWGVVLSTPQQPSEAAGGVDQLGQELAAPSRQAQTQHTQEHTVLP